MAQGLDAGEPGETPGGQERPGPRGLGRQLPPGLWTAALTQPPAATFPHCQNRLPSLLRMADQLLRPSTLLFWAVFSGYSFSSRKKQEQCLCGKGTLELLLHTAGKKGARDSRPRTTIESNPDADLCQMGPQHRNHSAKDTEQGAPPRDEVSGWGF